MSLGTATGHAEPAIPKATQAPMVRARYRGLDGLRAIAVGLVLVYHLFPGLLPGGFLGVDVFFAISGFLITSLLLSEWSASGRIRLADFWRRRARRLLPALGLVIATVSTAALVVGGDVLVGIGRQIAGAALFMSNWTSIAAGSDYFAKDAPELFRNTWSLGIEEQFYLVLPLLALVLVRLPGRAGRIGRLPDLRPAFRGGELVAPAGELDLQLEPRIRRARLEVIGVEVLEGWQAGVLGPLIGGGKAMGIGIGAW